MALRQPITDAAIVAAVAAHDPALAALVQARLRSLRLAHLHTLPVAPPNGPVPTLADLAQRAQRALDRALGRSPLP
jgi:hypothetical protein